MDHKKLKLKESIELKKLKKLNYNVNELSIL